MKAAAMRLWKDIWQYKQAILLFLAYYIIVHALFHAFCPSVLITGFPCAGCGMTRAVIFMLTGQFARSWNVNPMALPFLLFVAYIVVFRYFLGKKVPGVKAIGGVLLTVMLIAYLYRMITVFPNRPPYVYTSGNLLERCVPFYGDILRSLFGI